MLRALIRSWSFHHWTSAIASTLLLVRTAVFGLLSTFFGFKFSFKLALQISIKDYSEKKTVPRELWESVVSTVLPLIFTDSERKYVFLNALFYTKNRWWKRCAWREKVFLGHGHIRIWYVRKDVFWVCLFSYICKFPPRHTCGTEVTALSTVMYVHISVNFIAKPL